MEDTLHKEIIHSLSNYISPTDFISLSIISKTMNSKCEHKTIELMEDCCCELHKKYSEMEQIVWSSKCKNKKRGWCDGCHKTTAAYFPCSTFSHITHNLEVDYYHFPRDVDLLSFYREGVKIGYTML